MRYSSSRCSCVIITDESTKDTKHTKDTKNTENRIPALLGGGYRGVGAGPWPAPDVAVGAGAALDAVAARVSRDPAPGREASISKAAPAPTVRMTAHPPLSPPLPVYSCLAPHASAGSGDLLGLRTEE